MEMLVLLFIILANLYVLITADSYWAILNVAVIILASIALGALINRDANR